MLTLFFLPDLDLLRTTKFLIIIIIIIIMPHKGPTDEAYGRHNDRANGAANAI